jgi:hypothetical protein
VSDFLPPNTLWDEPMSSDLTPRTFWSSHSHQPALKDNIENVLGAVVHLPLKYWKSKMFFKGALDVKLATFTSGQFPARLVPGKSHPVFSLKPVPGRIGFVVSPCTSKKPRKPESYLYIIIGCELLHTRTRMDRNSYILREIRFPIPRSLAFTLRFLGEVPERCLQSKDA